MSNKIYVGNLSYKATEDGLAEVCGEYGEVVSARIITDRDTGRSKGFAFVEYASSASVEGAIRGLEGTDYLGRPLRVSEAREQAPRGDRPDRGSRPRY